MATTSLEAIRRITIEAQEKGLADVAAKLDKVAKAQEGVVASSTSVEKSSGSTEQAFKRTERSLDANVVAYDRYARSVKAVADAQAQGLTTEQRAGELFSLAEMRLRKATGATEDFGKAAGPARHEWINLSRQLQDVGVSLQGGMSPLTVLAQQGSQISDVFISSKASIGDFVTGAVAGAGRFLLAWGPLAAAVGAVGAGAFAAMRTLGQEREASTATTSGLGRLSGISANQVPGLAERSRTPGLSLGDAREGVLEFIKAGAEAQTTLQAMALASSVAALRGTELSDAYKLLAGVIRDPAAAARQLGDEYRILDNDQRKNIATMQASGDRAGATKAVFDALRGVVISNADATSMWAKAWIAVKDAAAGAADAVAKAVKTGTAEEQLRAMQAQRRALERASQEGQAVIKPPSSFVPPTAPTVQPAPRQAPAVRSPSGPTASDLEAFKQEEVIRQNVLELTKQQTAAAEAARLVTANLAAAIRDQTAAFQDQVKVMNAGTIEQRALATETQTYNEAIRNGIVPELARNQAQIAGNLIREQAKATTRDILRDQQLEIDINNRMARAYREGGASLEIVIAKLKEEQSVRKAGMDINDKDVRQRIEGAGKVAASEQKLEKARKDRQEGRPAWMTEGYLNIPHDKAEWEDRAKAISDVRVQLNDLVNKHEQLNEVGVKSVGMTDALGNSTTNLAAGVAAANDRIDKGEDLMRRWGQALQDARMEADAAASSTSAFATAQKIANEYIRQGRMQPGRGLPPPAGLAYSREFDSSPFSAGSDKPMSQRGGFTGVFDIGAAMAAKRDEEKKTEQQVFDQMREAQKAGQQRQLQNASSAIQEQISALQDQKSALGDNTQALEDNVSALEKETTKRREQLDKQIDKLEKALNPSRPDPYAERNPDYFYRFGTQAFKENDPTQALLVAAEAERDGLDNQLDAMKEQLDQQKKAVELQQKAIDAQISGYEAQDKQLSRAASLLSAGVDLSAQEVAGLQRILAAIGGLGDYTRMQAANVQQTGKAVSDIVTAAPTPQYANAPQLAAFNAAKISSYGYERGKTGFSGFFASGGYIPPGSWGVAGESGPEVISRKRAIAGPATVTPIGSGSRPIVVNQTFVSQGGARELRASRGEIAQRSSSEMRRSLGAR